MEYPPEFPEHAQAKVSAARIRAAKVLAAAKGSPETAAIHYVMSIFAAFAHEACKLGRHGNWTVARIESAAEKFLYHLAAQAQSECAEMGLYIWDMRSQWSLTHKLSSTMLRWELSPRPVKQKILRSFKASAEWEEYRSELLEVADIQGNPAGVEVPEPGQRRGYRKEIDDWMAREEIPNLDAAARELAISIDVLKSIRSNQGRPRFSEETLKAVLAKITTPKT